MIRFFVVSLFIHGALTAWLITRAGPARASRAQTVVVLNTRAGRGHAEANTKPRARARRRPEQRILQRALEMETADTASASATRTMNANDESNKSNFESAATVGAEELGVLVTYPVLSRRLGEHGRVDVLAEFKNGALQSTRILRSSGFARLDHAAELALTRWSRDTTRAQPLQVRFNFQLTE